MKIPRRTRRSEVASVVSLVPMMRREAPKRNVVVGFVYLLVLWMVCTWALFVVQNYTGLS